MATTARGERPVRSAELEYGDSCEKSCTPDATSAAIPLLEWHDSVLKGLITTVAATVTGVARAVFGRRETPVELAPGDRAPEFSLVGSDGREYRLADYAGRSAVVLAWFPKAFTSG